VTQFEWVVTFELKYNAVWATRDASIVSGEDIHSAMKDAEKMIAEKIVGKADAYRVTGLVRYKPIRKGRK
jgi:hypothetical protein